MNKIINIFVLVLISLIFIGLCIAVDTPPDITNVTNTSYNSTQQYVNWTSNQTAHNRVVYGYTQGTEDENNCSGTWAVGWECAASYDGNWSSYAMASTGTTAYIYFNYTLPANVSQADTLYRIKDGGGTPEHNLTIPAACWNTTIRVRATSDHDGAHSIAWHCYNGSAWISIHSEIDTRSIYEQEMLWYKWSAWDNSTASPNVTLSGLTASTSYDFVVWSYNTSDISKTNNSSTYSFTTAASTYIPPNPTTLADTTGNFWVNHTWAAGSGNVTNSYNVSVNDTWHNGTTNAYWNNTPLTAHGWSNITVYAWNSSDTGMISAGSVTDDKQIPNNAITITNTSDWSGDEDENVYVDYDATDADSDTPTFSCNRTDLFADFNTGTGIGNWQTDCHDEGTYSVNFGVSDGYGSTNNYTMTVAVASIELIPGTPINLANTFGNYWVNYTWSAGSGNITDSYNVSHNGVWTNNTTLTYMNNQVGCDNWSNITVWAFNSTGAGILSASSTSDQVQAIIEKFTNPTFVFASGAIVLSAGAFFIAVGGWINRRRKRW